MEDLLNATLGDRVPRRGNQFTRWLGRFLMRCLGGWRVQGEFPNEPKMVVAVGPHTSNWDFVVAMPVVLALGLKLSYLAKHTLFRPPFHLFFEMFGGIPLDRANPAGVVSTMANTFAERSQLILAIAPEGTRGETAGLKSGFLRIARTADVPVLLVGLDFERRIIDFGPLIRPVADIEADKKQVLDYFAGFTGKRPQSVDHHVR